MMDAGTITAGVDVVVDELNEVLVLSPIDVARHSPTEESLSATWIHFGFGALGDVRSQTAQRLLQLDSSTTRICFQ